MKWNLRDNMQEIESSLHLFKPPKYSSKNSQWYSSFYEALSNSNNPLYWDISGIMSMISFGYVCGNRTLIKEISRVPWLSHLDENGLILFEQFPKHNLLWLSEKEIAKNLKNLLKKELLNVCQNRSQIFILLSGGLDSRIIAALLAELYESGEIKPKPVAVCWGLRNSRDVVYSYETAKILNFDWVHVELSPETLYQNIYLSAEILGSMVSPIHLHGMSWFKSVPKDSLVINGSYGDSVGRAEFSRRHILELTHHHPQNYNCILNDSITANAINEIKSDINNLNLRSIDEKPYVLNELEMQAEYMRSMIAQSMTLINQYCTVYHAFTNPEVYSFMWSIHPSARGDSCYFELFKLLNSKLSQIPWTRTNKNLFGKSPIVFKNLDPAYHKYDEWISNDLFDDLSSLIDLDLFSELKIFNPISLKEISYRVKKIIGNKRDYDLYIWLASFRLFYDFVIKNEKQVDVVMPSRNSINSHKCKPEAQKSKIKGRFQRSNIYKNRIKPIRLKLMKIKAIITYPPIKPS